MIRRSLLLLRIIRTIPLLNDRISLLILDRVRIYEALLLRTLSRLLSELDLLTTITRR